MELQQLVGEVGEVGDDAGLVARLRQVREGVDRLKVEQLALAATWVQWHPFVIADDYDGDEDLAGAPRLVAERARARNAIWEQEGHVVTPATTGSGTGGDATAACADPAPSARGTLAGASSSPAAGEPATSGAGVSGFVASGGEHGADLGVDPGTGVRGLWTVEEFSISTFATAAGMGLGAAERLLLEAEQLRVRLPRLFARTMAGRTRVWRARTLARATLFLSEEACGYVDAQLDLVPLNFGQAQLDGLIKRALIEHMPEEYEDLEERFAAPPARDVVFKHARNGTGDTSVQAVLPVVEGRILEDVIDHLAATLTAQGWKLTAGELRSYAMGDLARLRYDGQHPLTPPETPNSGSNSGPNSGPNRGSTGAQLPDRPPDGPNDGPAGPSWCGDPNCTGNRHDDAPAGTSAASSALSATLEAGPAGPEGPVTTGVPVTTGGAGVPRGKILMYLHVQARDLFPFGIPNTGPPPPGAPSGTGGAGAAGANHGDDAAGRPATRASGPPIEPPPGLTGPTGLTGSTGSSLGMDPGRLRRTPVRIEARGIPAGTFISAAELAPMFYRPSALTPHGRPCTGYCLTRPTGPPTGPPDGPPAGSILDRRRHRSDSSRSGGIEGTALPGTCGTDSTGVSTAPGSVEVAAEAGETVLPGMGGTHSTGVSTAPGTTEVAAEAGETVRLGTDGTGGTDSTGVSTAPGTTVVAAGAGETVLPGTDGTGGTGETVLLGASVDRPGSGAAGATGADGATGATGASGAAGSGLACFAPEIIVRPVLDLDEPLATDCYTPSERLREQLVLAEDRCAFPWCARTARACDLDHIQAWHTTRPRTGPNAGAEVATGGATCPCNLAPLCRAHHRLKTHARADAASRGRHAAWTYVKLDTGTYLWTGPHGLRLLRTPWGTYDTQNTGIHEPDEPGQTSKTSDHRDPNGPNDPTGATGANGPTGVGGSNGSTGPTGVGGSNGPTDPTGVGGATGPTGVGGSNGPTDTTGTPGVSERSASGSMSPQRERANRAHWSEATLENRDILEACNHDIIKRADQARAARRRAEDAAADDCRPDEPPF
ncbi:hypothetical protein GCG21_06470 [Pseudactinotalea sp. HY160]|uniref:HNH endonuclease signature motif containing protein n=1 Tax=Pseudactinotalea sp. HY160 TaxID=2654490 RepID=UPI00128C7AE4|nr:HNH endonuclease signature motif containing protein [Pseudactinotalea sp. HY160]MPV49656.1 hypothetical protein [Pseudactinotalea sp. HY160]